MKSLLISLLSLSLFVSVGCSRAPEPEPLATDQEIAAMLAGRQDAEALLARAGENASPAEDPTEIPEGSIAVRMMFLEQVREDEAVTAFLQDPAQSATLEQLLVLDRSGWVKMAGAPTLVVKEGESAEMMMTREFGIRADENPKDINRERLLVVFVGAEDSTDRTVLLDATVQWTPLNGETEQLGPMEMTLPKDGRWAFFRLEGSESKWVGVSAPPRGFEQGS